VTAPAAWRHSEPDWIEPYWAKCGNTSGPLVCGCTTPEPDPASPCGRMYLWTTGVLPCMWYPAQHPEQSGHTHQPTLCLRCHHPIERAPEGAP
jgi:hypothetical protein